MQQAVINGVAKFFEAYLTRKPTEDELHVLNTRYSIEFDDMVAYANRHDTTFEGLLEGRLRVEYAAEIKQEDEAYRLQLQFSNAVVVLREGITQLKAAAEAIVASDVTGLVLENLSDIPGYDVTLLEPHRLEIELKEAMKVCHDAYLKEMVMRKDPKLDSVASDGINWYAQIKADMRLTVPSIKRIREIFNPSFVSIADGRRIAELVIEGVIK